MRDFILDNLTDIVLQECESKTPIPRFRKIIASLSDVLGVSMLVDAINHPKFGKGAESTVLGHFYAEGAPECENGASVIKRDQGGEKPLVQGKVTVPEGRPIAGAKLDVWQTAASGACKGKP